MIRFVARLALVLVVIIEAWGCGPISQHHLADSAESPMAPTSCVDSISQDTVVYDTTQVTEQPRVRSGPRSSYPTIPLERRIQGRVLIGLVVNASGAIDQSSVRIVQKVHPDLDKEARRWVRGVSYWPGCRSGRAVRVYIVIPVDFKVWG
jgi:TonB family protein